jgi:hypothetical protein
MNRRLVAIWATGVFSAHGGAQTSAPGAREVPAHTVPVPDTVSPQMQEIIGAPINPNWRTFRPLPRDLG